MSKSRSAHRPIILGVVGDSAAGKTTLTNGIARILGRDRVVTLCTDDYHSQDREARAKSGMTALDPRANYIDILESHVQSLRHGRPILKPVYNHTDGTFAPPVYVEPKDYVVVEGLQGYATRAMRECFDVKVYLEPEEALRRAWKVQRDVGERGYDEEEVRDQIDRRVKDSETYIKPQRTYADMVVRFARPEGREDMDGAHLDAHLTLRPTLPHPDLTPILDAGAEKGVTLELSRDVDGKPVDVLEIAGDIDDDGARAMEDLVWSLIPEVGNLRKKVGFFTDGENRERVSHTLALSQLLITYHVVKAALGETTV